MGRHRIRPIEIDFGAAPPCTTQEIFNEWWKVARLIREDEEVTFCTDCTPEFKGENMALMRCSNPYIKFYRDPKGELYGALKPTWPNFDVEVQSSNEPFWPAIISNSIANDLGMR